MSGSPQIVAILLAVFAIIAVVLLSREASMDIASPLRNWLWARDARRILARNRYPETLRRAYWNEAEYQNDKHRLAALGYVISSEELNDPYVSPPAWMGPGQPPRRRVPAYHVIYEHRGGPSET